VVTADGGDNGCISDSLHGGEGVRSAPRLTKEDAVTPTFCKKKIKLFMQIGAHIKL
jgi:hypothetical protein